MTAGGGAIRKSKWASSPRKVFPRSGSILRLLTATATAFIISHGQMEGTCSGSNSPARRSSSLEAGVSSSSQHQGIHADTSTTRPRATRLAISNGALYMGVLAQGHSLRELQIDTFAQLTNASRGFRRPCPPLVGFSGLTLRMERIKEHLFGTREVPRLNPFPQNDLQFRIVDLVNFNRRNQSCLPPRRVSSKRNHQVPKIYSPTRSGRFFFTHPRR